MKRILSMLLIAVMALTAVPALAANDAGTNYTLSTEGVVVLQDIADRNITPVEGALDVNPVIEGQSPTTGIPMIQQYASVPSPSGPPSKRPIASSHTDNASAQMVR